MVNIKDKLFLEDIEKAQNNSGILGEQYVATCPILRTFKADYLEEAFGDTSCTYNEAQDALDFNKQCKERVKEKRDFLANYAS